MSVEATPVTDPDGPSSAYLTLDDFIQVDGQTNLYAYSSVDGEDPGTLNVVRVQLAMTSADAKVNQLLSRYRGGATTSVLSTDPGFPLLKQAAAYFATSYVYGSRGARDVIDPTTGQFNPMLNKANYWNAEAKRLLMQWVESSLNTLPPGTFQNIDIAWGDDNTACPAWGW